MKQHTKKQALLLGAYGQTNLGDDLLMYNYLTYLTDLGFTDIYVNVSERQHLPSVIKEKFPALQVFETYKTSPLHMLKLMWKSDHIFYGGGTVYKELYSSTGRRSPYTVIAGVMLFNLTARVLGKKVTGLHIGIGTIKTGLGRLITTIALRACTKTVFRDERSYVYARDVLKVPQTIIEHSTDGLFLNPAWRKRWHEAQLPARAKEKSVVGINVLSDIPDWVDRAAYLEVMRQFVLYLLKNDVTVVFLPFQTGFNKNNDLAFINAEIIPHMKGYKNYIVADVRIDTIISYLKQIDILVGMRFHSLLLATAAETPFLAIAYDTKCWRFVEEIGYKYAHKIEDISAEKLIQSYHDLLADRSNVKTTLGKVANAHFQTAATWAKKYKA